MLSIIISSYQENYFSALEKNIAETCGIEYEIIKIENPAKMGICEAYNKGACIAKFQNLLFLHEDVFFHTENWGSKLLEWLQNSEIGIVGIAGSNYVANSPTAWWNKPDSKFINIIETEIKTNFHKKTSFEGDIKDVFLVDGVFLACRKNIYKEFPFNESIKGFHAYDVDFSLKVSTKYQNVVVNNFLLEHFSRGRQSKEWLENIIFVRKNNKIPNQKTNKVFELFVFNNFLKQMQEFGFSRKDILKNYIIFINPKFIGFRGFIQNILKLPGLIFKK